MYRRIRIAFDIISKEKNRIWHEFWIKRMLFSDNCKQNEEKKKLKKKIVPDYYNVCNFKPD